MAARPRTLVAGVVPVAVGSAVAVREHTFSLVPALAALLGALLIQVGTNMANDYFDWKKGADTSERLGPARVTAQGLIAPEQVWWGAMACFAAAMVVGLYLVSVGGWPILTVGLLSIAAGYAYTGGPFPLGYNGLGDLFVMIFFGFVAVCGSYFVQTGRLSALVITASVPVGALGVALLAVNNVRDADTDAKAGKRTLVVRWGRGFGRAEYSVMLLLAFVVPAALWATGMASAAVLVSYAAAPLAVAPLKRVFKEQGATLNLALAGTAKLQWLFGLLFAAGLAW
ncbi:MAG: 1,4-dihydroxy-2-naphthoate polyprenyltransferase [Myxococcaceae bacterium]|nr:1,4-dihydroxy-2-naphthoate polyprenyltransferase [Myxococcaceae bacterium]